MTVSSSGTGDLLAVYQGLFDTSPDPIYIEDEQGVVLDANQAACRFQGMTREELIGCNVHTLVPESERERLEQDFQRWFSGEITTYEGFSQKPDGSIIPVEVHGIRIDHSGRPAVILHVRDISKLHRKSHEYEMIFEHMIAGCVLYEVVPDDAGHVKDLRHLAVNKAFERIIGKSVAEVTGRTIKEIFPNIQDSWIENLGRVGVTGTSVKIEEYGRDLDRYFEVSAYSPEPGKVVSVFFDTTDRHKAMSVMKDQQERERQLLAAQKLESLGVLAGGIAHDFNNLLVGVLGNSELALMHLDGQHASAEYLQQIRIAGKRASELTQLMLAYSGRAPINRGPVNLNEVIRETYRLVSMAISKKISVHLMLDESIPSMVADIAQLRQLIMNVITNASDAIGDQPGEIFIESSRQQLAAASFKPIGDIPALEPGPYIVFEVRDTGCGIEPAFQARIFEPFYTSKFSGRGLGLAAVLGIMKAHGGGIEMQSRVGQGTVFRFAFPVMSEKNRIVLDQQTHDASAPLSGGKRFHVLVVDDEPVVRKVLRRSLERIGYVVEEAEDGRQAMEVLRASPAFDLVLLDLTMPHLGGEETINQMSQAGFSCPVLIMSGYAESETMERLSTPMIRGYLEKPFDIETIVSKVRAAIGPSA